MANAPQIVAVAALVVGAAGFFHGWHETGKRRTAERMLAEARKERTQPARRAQTEERMALNAESVPAALPVTSGDDAAAVRRFQQDLARQRAKEAIAGAAAQLQFIGSREIQEEIARQFRLNLRLRYGAFFAERGLSEAKISAFEDALMEKFWTMSDVLIATRGVGMSDHETAELRRQQLVASDEKVRFAVGEELYREYMRYDTTADARGLVEALAGKLFYSEPLSAVQGAQLAGLITANSNGVRRPDEWLRRQVLAGETVGPSWSDVDWNAVVGQAGNILSQSQVFALRALAADAQLRRDIEQRLKEADQRGRNR